MNRRYVVVLAVIAAALLAFAAANIRQSVWMGSNARAVEQRVSEAERANIEIFEKVSPSVVQVAAQSAANPLSEESEGGGASGSLDQSMSSGIISALKRRLPTSSPLRPLMASEFIGCQI